MKKIVLYVLLVVTALLTGCSTGPKFSEVKDRIPALKTDMGRIYFYRDDSLFGAAIQPSIRLNNEIVGVSKPGGFFYVDAKPGKHEAICATEVTRKAVFTLEAGQTRYIKTSVGLGIIAGRVYPELVENSLGESEVMQIVYIGDQMPQYIKDAIASEKAAEEL